MALKDLPLAAAEDSAAADPEVIPLPESLFIDNTIFNHITFRALPEAEARMRINARLSTGFSPLWGDLKS